MKNYEQKYKEALEVAKRKLCFDKAGMVDSFTPNDIYEMFPELKENEDEKIRKALITAVSGTFKGNTLWHTDVTREEALAWLEKQGVQPRYNIGDVICDKSCTTLNKDAQPNMTIVDIQNGMYICDKGSFPVSQQDEYELVSKKFDTKLNDDSVSNELREASTKHAEKELKNQTFPDNLEFELIYTFEEGAKWNAAQKSADKVEHKFRVKYAGSEYNVLEVKDIAGVTYYGIEDEPNHIDYVQAENCERVGGYSIKEKGSPYPTKPAKFSEQKSTWSEEDEEILRTIISDGIRGAEFDMLQIDWLKSLKDRVLPQPMQEWTAEDEEELKIALDTLVKAGQHSSAKWLKNVCLVPQNTWKPSDEQMDALQYIYRNLNPQLFDKLGWDSIKTLESLYNDLKKLK